MTEPVTILMPVGPNYNPEWLKEAFDSAINQTYTPKEILIIDDGADLFNSGDHLYPFMPGEHLIQDALIFPQDNIGEAIKSAEEKLSNMSTYRFSLPVVVSSSDHYAYKTYSNEYTWYNKDKEILYRIWQSPTNLGFIAAYNLGMALADNDLVMFLAADDKLLPEAVEKAVQCYLDHDKKDAWYACSYIDNNGNEGTIPNNLALTTKHFFLDMCGGYPPAAFVGPDAALLSCLMKHAPDRIIKVEDGTPLYWIREHPDSETHTHTAKYVDEMNSIRNKLTLEFKLKDA